MRGHRLNFLLGLVVVLVLSSCNYSRSKESRVQVADACGLIDSRLANYDANIKPLIQNHCVQCHGASAKFPLHEYAISLDGLPTLESWARAARAVDEERMPPDGTPRLSTAEKKQLLSWSAAGAPKDAQAAEQAIKRCAKTEPTLLFEARQSRPKLLPFASRVSKIRHLLQEVSETSPLLAQLKLYDKDLGDHDYSVGIQPDDSWTKNKMAAWAHAIGPLCASPRLGELYPWPTQTSRYVKQAFGRDLTPDEQELANQLKQTTGITEAKRLELFCLSTLGSLEFVTQ